MPMNFGLDRSCIRVRNCLGDCSAISLAHSKNGRLADCAATGLELLVFVLVGLDTTDETLIYFDNAAKLLEIRPARFPNSMQHEPSRCLPNADLFRQLQTRYALASREKQVHCVNPLVQRNVRALEYRASAHREVFFALVAAVEAVLARRDPFAQTAYWTFGAFRPFAPKTLVEEGANRFVAWYRDYFGV